MKKKKITPEDLELNIEITNKGQVSNRVSVTLTCANTKNICMHTKKDQDCEQCSFEFLDTCGTTTIEPTATNQGEDCKPTINCLLTIEPACETKVGCDDSASHAQLCCPISDKANTLCANCYSADSCGNNTQCICQFTKDDCDSKQSPCQISVNISCTCVQSLEDTCPPPEIATDINKCNL